jgi:hypothetical protein
MILHYLEIRGFFVARDSRFFVAREDVVVGAVQLPPAADAAPPSKKGAGGAALLPSSFVFRPSSAQSAKRLLKPCFHPQNTFRRVNHNTSDFLADGSDLGLGVQLNPRSIVFNQLHGRLVQSASSLGVGGDAGLV